MKLAGVGRTSVQRAQSFPSRLLMTRAIVFATPKTTSTPTGSNVSLALRGAIVATLLTCANRVIYRTWSTRRLAVVTWSLALVRSSKTEQPVIVKTASRDVVLAKTQLRALSVNRTSILLISASSA